MQCFTCPLPQCFNLFLCFRIPKTNRFTFVNSTSNNLAIWTECDTSNSPCVIFSDIHPEHLLFLPCGGIPKTDSVVLVTSQCLSIWTEHNTITFVVISINRQVRYLVDQCCFQNEIFLSWYYFSDVADEGRSCITGIT